MNMLFGRKMIFAFAFFFLLVSVAFAVPASLNITRQVTIPTSLKAGDTGAILQVDLRNDDTRAFQNIVITAGFDYPLSGEAKTLQIPLMNPGETYTATFKFNVSKDADPGTYAVSLNVNYVEADTGASAGAVKKVSVSVSETPELEFSNISIESKPYVGEYFQIAAYVANKGALPATKITATAASASSEISWLPEVQDAGTIEAGETGKILFKGFVSSHAASGAYPATFNISYSNESAFNNFILDVYGKPIIRLAGVTGDSDYVVGKKVSLSVQLENSGSDDAKSVKASLLDGFKGTLDSYVGAINKDDSSSAIFDVTPQKSGMNSIMLKVEWEGKDGTKYSENVPLSLFIYDAPLGIEFFIIPLLIIGGLGYYLFRKKKFKLLMKKIE